MAPLRNARLFVALTRPTMFAGVTYSLFVANAIVATELFLILKTPWVLALALVFHALAYAGCRKEPRFFELWLAKAALCPRIPNFAFWRCNSYRP